jgi:hypothetical protein
VGGSFLKIDNVFHKIQTGHLTSPRIGRSDRGDLAVCCSERLVRQTSLTRRCLPGYWRQWLSTLPVPLGAH